MSTKDKFLNRLKYLRNKRDESAERILLRGQTLQTCSDSERDIYREYNNRISEILEFSRQFELDKLLLDELKGDDDY